VQALFITATGTNVGKTYTTLKLIEAFAKQGIRVGVFKPVETGVEDEPIDAKRLLEACQKVNPAFQNLTPRDITTYTFSLPASPFCADVNREIVLEKIIEKYQKLSKLCDLLLIEGAGGLMVPIKSDFMMIDLAQRLEANVLLVTPSRLGCINDTLLSMEALESRNIRFDWCVNLYRDREDFKRVTEPFYDRVFPNWWSIEDGLDRFIRDYKL